MYQPYVNSAGSDPDALRRYLAALKRPAPHPGVGGANLSGLGGAGGMDALNPQLHTPQPSSTMDWTSTPDYNGLITGSPEVLTANSNRDAANVNLTNLRHMIANQAVAHYGAVPNWAKLTSVSPKNWNIANDLDPTTSDYAAENTAAGTSTIGQLNHAHSQNIANLRAELASKGILDSGQDALMESEEGRRYAGAADSASNDLMATLLKAQQDYLSGMSPYDQSSSAAAGTAAARLSGSNQFDQQSYHAVKDPGFTANGGDVYKDENGSYWTANHSPVSKNDLRSTTAAPPPATLPVPGGASRPFLPG